MLKIALRSAWTNKLRLLFTVIAIVLGVTFMTGVLILGDTIDRVFDDLFSDGFDDVDVQVQGTEIFDAGAGFASPREALDLDLVDEIVATPGVAAAEPFIQVATSGATNQVIAPDGDQIGVSANGPPTLLESWITDEDLSPYSIEAGAPPSADDEVAINVAAAENADLEIGDTVTVISQLGTTDYELVGTFLFGTAESAGGAVTADFTFAEVQRIAGLQDETQVIQIRGDGSVTDDELAAAIDAILPDSAEAITGQEAADQLSDSVSEGFQFFQILLLVFVGIAIVVGSFIIYNTFAILIAQRTREMALLRAVGASRRQVFSSVVLEAAITGLVATVVGLLLGIGLANLVVSILASSGLDTPTTSLVVAPFTLIAAFTVGLVLTVLLSLVPAFQATRVAPLAALRSIHSESEPLSKRTIAIAIGVVSVLALPVLLLGAVVLAVVLLVILAVTPARAFRTTIGVLLLLIAAGALFAAANDAPEIAGAGAFLLILGSIVIGPVLAGPTVRLLGLPLRAVGGLTGRLAIENAARSPRRTAATASALIIGVALVGFILIFGSSARASITAEVERAFTGDLIVQGESAGLGIPAGFPTSVADDIAAVDGVAETSRVGFAQAQVTYANGSSSTQFITALDPATALDLFQPRMESGSFSDLTTDGIVVDVGVAEDEDLSVGDSVTLTGSNGEDLSLTVQAISDDLTFVGYWAVDTETYRELVNDPQLLQVIVRAEAGADLSDVRAGIDDAISVNPGLEVLDRDEFVGDLASQITSLLTFVTALLLMSVLIATIGIINTLLLAINERIRELGLLRAVGMTRGQVFRSVTLEAILIAVLGTVIGLVIGLIASRSLIAALGDFGLTTFDVPVGTLAIVVIGGALLGTVAAMYPAWRATRIKLLDAIASE